MNDAQEAYDKIIRPIEEQMIRSIWRIVRDRADAEDAMQDALANVWKGWDRVCRHSNAQALVLKICIDAAFDLTRRRLRDRRQLNLSGLSSEPEDRSPIPAEAAENSEQYESMIAAIHLLSRQQATATLMRIVQEQSYREIAAAMGSTEATARKHVARGRKRLKAALSRFNPNRPNVGPT